MKHEIKLCKPYNTVEKYHIILGKYQNPFAN